MNIVLQTGERICTNKGADPHVLKDGLQTLQLAAEAKSIPVRFSAQGESCKISAIGLARCHAG
jgi:hypothetical protein